MQKIKTLNYQIVVNCGNYESIRLGAEWTPKGDDINGEMLAAESELRAAAEAIINSRRTTAPAQQPANVQTNCTQNANETQTNCTQNANGKEVLTLDSTKLAAICEKINKGTKLDVVLQYFEPADENVMNVLKLAEKMQ